MGEAMGEASASSWWSDAPITDEQIDVIRRDLDTPPAHGGRSFAPFVARKLLAELDRLRAQLAEIGETGTEWTVRYANGDTLYASTEGYARMSAQRDVSATLIRRVVGEWREVEQ